MYKQNVACLSLFHWYYFGKYSSGLDGLVRIPPTGGRSTCYYNRLHDSPISIPWWLKYPWMKNGYYSNSRLYNCFPMTHSLIGSKSRVNNRLFYFGIFLISFPISFSSFPCISIPCSGCSAFYRVKSNLQKKNFWRTTVINRVTKKKGSHFNIAI